MRKLCLLMLGLFAFASISAQTVDNEQPKQENKLEAKDVSEGQFYYAGKFEKTADIGLNIRAGFVEFGGAIQVAGPGDSWKVNLGGAYRCYIADNVFVEGAAGLYYGHSSYSYSESNTTSRNKVAPLDIRHNGSYSSTTTETKKDSSGGVGAYLTPRLGIIVSNGWGIYAAYEWDFYEFKFDNFDKRGYWKLGIVVPF